MLGAIIGDIAGSPYEFDDYNIKTTDFPLFSEELEITDDTIMTLAFAQGLMNGKKRTAFLSAKTTLSKRSYINCKGEYTSHILPFFTNFTI